MKSIKLEVYSDFVCPYCFLAEKPLFQAIDALTLEFDIELVWKPFELRPYPTPTLRPEGKYLTKVWKESIYPMARRLQTDIVLPKVSPQPYTKLAFEGAIYADQHKRSSEYHHRVFTAFFHDQLDIGDINILSDCAADIGLDRKDFYSALENGLHTKSCNKQLLFGQRDTAIKSVPTYVFPNGFRMSGLLEKAQLVTLIMNQGHLI